MLRVRDYGYLGDFKSEYIFIEKQDSIGYKIDSEDLDVELSARYLGLVEIGGEDFGWFNVKKIK
ncbi:hypothetical protein D3C80_2074270 [compost metagenome]